MKYLRDILAFIFALAIGLSTTLIVAGAVFNNPNFHDYDPYLVGWFYIILAMVIFAGSEWLLHCIMDIADYARHQNQTRDSRDKQ